MIVIYSTRLLRAVTPGSRWAVAITFFPFIICRSDARGKAGTVLTLNHERIHIRQQLELLVLGFYLWYLADYLRLRLKGCSHVEAYRKNVFEREAYDHGDDLSYLRVRKPYAFLRARTD